MTMKAGFQLLATLMVRLGRLIVWFYYSPVRIVGRENVPRQGPVLLVGNHANAMTDPILLGLTAKRRVSFLVTSPVRPIPWFGRITTWLGMIPVGRSATDPAHTRESLSGLTRAAEALAGGAAIGIFPGSRAREAREVKDIFSGAARLVQQALDAGVERLNVVPVGINYDNKRLFRSAVWIEVGTPIDARALVGGAQSGAEVRRVLTREIASGLREVVIHLDDSRLEPFLEDLEELDPATQSHRGERVFSLQQRKSIADGLNHFLKVRPETVASVGRALVSHRARLRPFGLRVDSGLLTDRGPMRLLALIWRSARLCFGFIPVLCGVLQNLLPLAVERSLVRFLPQSGAATIAVSRLLVGIPVFLLWYVASWWCLSRYFLPWLAWFWVLTMPFAGLFALRYFRTLRSVLHSWWLELRMLPHRRALRDLRDAQEKLRGRLGALSHEAAALRGPMPVRPTRWFERPAFRFSVLTALLLGCAGFFVVAGLRVGFRKNTLSALLQPAPDFSHTGTPELEALIGNDEQRLLRALEGMARLDRNLGELAEGFGSGRFSYYNDTDNDRISREMLTYLNCRTELLELILRYRAGHTIPPESLRLRASLVDLAAGCALYQHASRFVALFGDSPGAMRKLNEGEPAWGIPSGLYDTIRANLRNESNLTPLRTALSIYQNEAGRREALGLVANEPQATFHKIIRAAAVAAPSDSGFLAKTLRESVELKEQILYQGQSAVSRAVGSTRVRERSEGPRVRPSHLEKIQRLVRPGDILLERQDWFLSRAFMPGYWAHAALYIGTPEEVEAMGLQTHDWVAPHWEEFKHKAADGHSHAIIEAVPEGVRFTTLDHCLGVADSAAVLRPSKVTPEEVKQAIIRAFHHVGKSYDFEFDFFSADKVVCTELVARAYSGSPHLDFPLVSVMGRQTLPPTEMARKFAMERASPDRQLDLVIFLDGHSHGKSAVEAGEPGFAESVNRQGMTWFNSPD